MAMSGETVRDAAAADRQPRASALARASREALSDGGALAVAIPGFAPREAQQRLAGEIALAVEDRAVLLAEAGTEIGRAACRERV